MKRPPKKFKLGQVVNWLGEPRRIIQIRWFNKGTSGYWVYRPEGSPLFPPASWFGRIPARWYGK
jgi:hypothetical protein